MIGAWNWSTSMVEDEMEVERELQLSLEKRDKRGRRMHIRHNFK